MYKAVLQHGGASFSIRMYRGFDDVTEKPNMVFHQNRVQLWVDLLNYVKFVCVSLFRSSRLSVVELPVLSVTSVFSSGKFQHSKASTLPH